MNEAEYMKGFMRALYIESLKWVGIELLKFITVGVALYIFFRP